MTPQSSHGRTLAPGLAARLDPVCDRFESEWLGGRRPRLEDFLPLVAEDDRPALLRELLALELEHCARHGEQPTADEFRRRLPEHAALIDAAFAARFTVSVATPAGKTLSPAELLPGEAAAGVSGAAAVSRAGRYEVEREIARGGMGVVFRARDPDLKRSLAVKVLREEYRAVPQLARRFREEAQVTGQLQHPGIPPVHEVGTLPDGRPFFAMKLIKGQTLADLLRGRPSPQDDLPRWLGLFEQLCQTLAYAHSKGVIHRDLKPANVMVGAFGEVQVMDWGLAKVLADPRAAPDDDPQASAIAGVRDHEALQSRAGQVLGTPSYMAPEQARGEVDQLDGRCDVFGLGAILCEMLTGQPPFVGRGAEAVRRLAAVGDLADALARLDGCGGNGELLELARRCLAPAAGDRPRDAGVVAAAMTAYLGGVQERLRQAEQERATAQARAAEERKRRRVQLGLAAAVLALVVVGAGGGLLLQHYAAERQAEQARREEDRRHAVESALDRASDLRQQSRWREAAAVLGQARQVLGDAGPEELRRRLDVAEDEVKLITRLETIRLRRADVFDRAFDFRAAARDYATEFQEAGLGAVGDEEAAVAARVRASGASAQLVAALDDWAAITDEPGTRQWILGVARRADPDPWRDRIRDAENWENGASLQALAREVLQADAAKLAELSPQLLYGLGGRLGGPGGIAVLRAAQRRYPDDFWLNLVLGNRLHAAGRVEEAAGFYRVAVALRPDATAAHISLGSALRAKGDLDGAVAEARKAIELAPGLATAHSNLGNALNARGDLDGAIAAYRKAIELDPKDARAHDNLGHPLRAKGDVDGAIAEARKAIELNPRLVSAHNNLGNDLLGRGDIDGAIAEFRTAIDIDPGHAPAPVNLGRALMRRGDFGDARAAIGRGLELSPEGDPLRQYASELVRQCERLAALDERLSAVLGGRADPRDAAELAALGHLCRWYKRRYVAAARFYAEAFAADPGLAGSPTSGVLYDAACAAALGAAGRGEDATSLPDKVRLMLRRQALAWLRADLALCARLADGGEPATRQKKFERLQKSRKDADLASVRDGDALEQLSEDERREWRRLWAEVAGLSQRVGRKQ
jgi:serine/threonine-protein kinase